MAMRFAAIAIASVLATAGTFVVMGPLQGYAETSGGGALKAVSDFDAIADTSARSKAIFEEASRVLTHPRCINCHPATRSPTQGEDKHPHVPLMIASNSSMGPLGLACSTCHGAENRPIVGSRMKSIPGNAHWPLAPASMAWQGLTVSEICQQVKDHEPQRQPFARRSHKAYGRGSPGRLGLAPGRRTHRPSRLAGDLCRPDRRLGEDRCRMSGLIKRARPDTQQNCDFAEMELAVTLPAHHRKAQELDDEDNPRTCRCFRSYRIGRLGRLCRTHRLR